MVIHGIDSLEVAGCSGSQACSGEGDFVGPFALCEVLAGVTHFRHQAVEVLEHALHFVGNVRWVHQPSAFLSDTNIG